jgi:3-deoxy-manno-octulosonate cytidylyltransferase (CMP-KDO synthetase)
MRWIENGYSIRCAVTPWESIGIDTPEDLDRAARMLK